ncbi:hypothetical protein DFH07DRAFT_969379 [Mycena maculata]|uniref:Uncharacterized protein n=1 Tax=Mycena maculata TaxID=230809 RepID=A0AAD7HWN3_9AGAR|nr:hypothetical protein DFH07DRAFT_969379 [Mycena maculata]
MFAPCVDAALEFSTVHARFLECGMMSGSNTSYWNLNLVIGKVLRIYGVQLFCLRPKYNAEFYATIPPLLVSGELKYWEDVMMGLDTVGDVVLGIQKGTNHRKLVVIVAKE